MIEVDSTSGEVRFPPNYKYMGYPVDRNKVPSYEEALAKLREINYLLNKSGPGAMRRLAEVKRIAKEANNYDVWTSNCLNRDAGLFPINVMAYGTFMDPSSESYHSM